MTRASDNKFPKVYLEERLTDGSDTTTPAADHRSLFLGEDGLLHLKDSAAAVTDVGGGGSGRALLDATTLDGTYGDDFTATSLDAKWTRQGTDVGDEAFDASSEGWMSVDLGELPAAASYHQTITTADEFEVVLTSAYYVYNHAGNTNLGPYIVDSAGGGVAMVTYGGTVKLIVLTAYAWSADTSPVTVITLGDGNDWKDKKIWLSLVKRGSLYFGRFSFDGSTWSRFTWHYTNSFTVAKVGHGRLLDSAPNNQEQYRVDRFNVLNRLGRSANRVITPSSGTATYTASDTNGAFVPANAADANLTTVWAAADSTAPTWWLCTWSVAQSINRVMLRGGTGAIFGGGYLEFSDGTTIAIPQAVGVDQWLPIDFPTESTTTLKVWSTKNGAAAPQLSEVEAYLAS